MIYLNSVLIYYGADQLNQGNFSGCVLMRKRKLINIIKANARNICTKYFKNLKRVLLSTSSAVLPGNIGLDHVVRYALKVGISCLSIGFPSAKSFLCGSSQSYWEKLQ